MERFVTKAIILRRIDYAEADRVITFLTPERGKLAVIARGVRKEKSKLSGGIELFSESNITIVEGKGNLDILASARLIEYYRNIVSDYERVTAGYDVIKIINDITEDDAGSEFYEVLLTSLQSLDDLFIPTGLISSWYQLNILKLLGSEPNLSKDASGKKLDEQAKYVFDVGDGALVQDENGNVTADHIKSLRLLLTQQPKILLKVKGAKEAIEESSELIEKIFRNTPGL